MRRRLERLLVSVLALILLLSGCGAYGPGTDAARDGAGEDAVWEALENTDWGALRKAWEEADWEALYEELEGAWSTDFPDGAKDHYYQILDGEGECLYTVSGEDALAQLDGIFCGSGDGVWGKLVPGQESFTPACTYVLYAERTALAGEEPGAERAYREILRITAAEDQDTAVIRILNGLGGVELLPGLSLEPLLTFSVSLPAETAALLRNPARFSE